MEMHFIRGFRSYLRRLERALGANLKSETECCGIGITQCHTLLEIAYRGEVSLVDVAASLELDTSTLSRTVNTMVDFGWINRKTNPEDRRYITLTLTESGRALLERIEQMNNRYYAEVFSLIPEEKHPQIIESLELFLSAVAKCQKQSLSCCDADRICGEE